MERHEALASLLRAGVAKVARRDDGTLVALPGKHTAGPPSRDVLERAKPLAGADLRAAVVRHRLVGVDLRSLDSTPRPRFDAAQVVDRRG